VPPHLPARLAGAAAGAADDAAADGAAFGAACATIASPDSGSASIFAIASSSLIARPVRSADGAAFSFSMSCASALRTVTAWALCDVARRASAFCSAISASCVLPVSCSCWLALDSIWSTSSSIHASRLRDRSWYCCCSACWALCASASLPSSCASCVSTWCVPVSACSVFVRSSAVCASSDFWRATNEASSRSTLRFSA
jgi:hypothetical protein